MKQQTISAKPVPVVDRASKRGTGTAPSTSLGLIKSWSYSRLVVYESCAFRAFLQMVERIPDTSPKPAADRGTAIHTEAELAVMGKKDPTHNLRHFKPEFNAMLTRYKAKAVSLEGEWGFDHNWQPCEYKSAWGRIKADAVVFLDAKSRVFDNTGKLLQDYGTHACVIDYKTGRKFGNEIKHGEQLQLYSLATFIRYPKIQNVTAELWYLDLDDMTPLHITRQVAMTRYLKNFDQRARLMTNATRFPPNPNMHSCRYCPYKPAPHGTGDCKVGVCL